MVYVINIIPDIEEIIIEQVKDYFYADVKFKEIFPNFGDINISSVHPVAYLIDAEIRGKPEPKGLFPSLTIANDNDNKNPEIDIATIIKDIKITSAEVQDMKDHRSIYVISDEDVQALDQLTQDSGYVWSKGVQQRRRASLVSEIWSVNARVKNRIYDILTNFFIGNKRFTLKEDYDIVIDEKSISGEKSGNYNYDFGKMLHGAILRMSVDYVIAQYYVDTDMVSLTGVIHTEGEVHR